MNNKTPTTGTEVCTLVDEFLEATPEKPHKKQLKLLSRFLCQRETLFTKYNQDMLCQWCKTPHSSEMLLALLYPTSDWNWTEDRARFCYNCMTNQDDHHPIIPGPWLQQEWDMRDPTNHSEQYTNMAGWKDHKPTNWMVAVPNGDYLADSALLLHQWDEASFTLATTSLGPHHCCTDSRELAFYQLYGTLPGCSCCPHEGGIRWGLYQSSSPELQRCSELC